MVVSDVHKKLTPYAKIPDTAIRNRLDSAPSRQIIVSKDPILIRQLVTLGGTNARASSVKLASCAAIARAVSSIHGLRSVGDGLRSLQTKVRSTQGPALGPVPSTLVESSGVSSLQVNQNEQPGMPAAMGAQHSHMGAQHYYNRGSTQPHGGSTQPHGGSILPQHGLNTGGYCSPNLLSVGLLQTQYPWLSIPASCSSVPSPMPDTSYPWQPQVLAGGNGQSNHAGSPLYTFAAPAAVPSPARFPGHQPSEQAMSGATDGNWARFPSILRQRNVLSCGDGQSIHAGSPLYTFVAPAAVPAPAGFPGHQPPEQATPGAIDGNWARFPPILRQRNILSSGDCQSSHAAGSPQYTSAAPAAGAALPAAGAGPPAAGGASPTAGVGPPAAGAGPPTAGAGPPAAEACSPNAGAGPPAAGACPPTAGAGPPAAGACPPAAAATTPTAGAAPPRAGAGPPAARATPSISGAGPPAAGAGPPTAGASPPSAGAGPAPGPQPRPPFQGPFSRLFYPMGAPFPKSLEKQQLTPAQLRDRIGLCDKRQPLPDIVPYSHQEAPFKDWCTRPVDLQREKGLKALSAESLRDCLGVVSRFLGYCFQYHIVPPQDLSLELFSNQELWVHFVEFTMARSKVPHVLSVLNYGSRAMKYLRQTSTWAKSDPAKDAHLVTIIELTNKLSEQLRANEHLVKSPSKVSGPVLNLPSQEQLLRLQLELQDKVGWWWGQGGLRDALCV